DKAGGTTVPPPLQSVRRANGLRKTAAPPPDCQAFAPLLAPVDPAFAAKTGPRLGWRHAL
ncbi:MAG: hypothetical protein ACKOJF_18065, partial [Planctomycetaceae bacterium]